MKRFLLGIVTLSMLALPSFSFSSDSVYGIYTDNVNFRQNETKRDEVSYLKQNIEDVQNKIIKADTTAESALMNIMKQISAPNMYQAIKNKTDLVKCDTSLSESEQNTKVFKIISEYVSQLILSNYHNPAADKAEVSRQLALVKNSANTYTELNEKILNTDAVVSAITDINKQEKIKAAIKKLSDVLNTRIIDVSDIVTQIETLTE